VYRALLGVEKIAIIAVWRAPVERSIVKVILIFFAADHAKAVQHTLEPAQLTFTAMIQGSHLIPHENVPVQKVERIRPARLMGTGVQTP